MTAGGAYPLFVKPQREVISMSNSPQASELAGKFILQCGTVSIAKMEVHIEALGQAWTFILSLFKIGF